MVSEEIGLNAHLQAAGIEVVETDLGEYIVQIRGESPSHIIAPVVHLNKEAIEADFRRTHRKLPPMRKLKTVADLVAEARAVLREKFLVADVGITGANLLIAETGTLGDRHQRGQRRSHLDAAAHPCRHRLDREGRADARRRLDHPPPALPLGDRAGHRHLHDLRHRSLAATAIPTDPRPITSSCSTMDGARCWAACSRTCSAASAAAPASTIARSMARSEAMPTARSIRDRWARC